MDLPAEVSCKLAYTLTDAAVAALGLALGTHAQVYFSSVFKVYRCLAYPAVPGSFVLTQKGITLVYTAVPGRREPRWTGVAPSPLLLALQRHLRAALLAAALAMPLLPSSGARSISGSSWQTCSQCNKVAVCMYNNVQISDLQQG